MDMRELRAAAAAAATATEQQCQCSEQDQSARPATRTDQDHELWAAEVHVVPEQRWLEVSIGVRSR